MNRVLFSRFRGTTACTARPTSLRADPLGCRVTRTVNSSRPHRGAQQMSLFVFSLSRAQPGTPRFDPRSGSAQTKTVYRVGTRGPVMTKRSEGGWERKEEKREPSRV